MKARELVDHLRGVWQVSIRRACQVVLLEKSTYHYQSRRPSRAALRQRMREIAETRVRYGYRRIHIMLERVTALYGLLQDKRNLGLRKI